jgi:hypothetical protein
LDNTDAEGQLAAFLARFTPEIGGRAAEAIETLRARLPGATVMVYDNYNALAVGFGPGDRASEAILSIAVFPRRVALFLLRGVGLPDPDKILQGDGHQVRSVTLDTAERLSDPPVSKIIDAALGASPKPIPSRAAGRLIIKSISAKQRPRRPTLKPAGSAQRPRR